MYIKLKNSYLKLKINKGNKVVQKEHSNLHVHT